MKKYFAVLLILALSMLSVTGCGGQEKESAGGDTKEPTYTLTFSAQAAADYPTTVSAKRAADKISELTKGDVFIRIHPTSSLGNYTQVYEEVMRGTIDMANLTIPSQYDARLEMNYIPYMATNYEDLGKIFSPGSYFWDAYTKVHADLGVTLLAINMDGFMGIGAAKMDTSDLVNFDHSRNELLRVPENEIFSAVAAAMGFRTTSIAYSELFPALQTGVADGWIGGNSYINYTAFRDTIRYFIDYRYLMENIGTIINTQKLESLPEDYQKIIREVFLEEAELSLKEIEKIDQEGNDKLRDSGIEVVEFTPEEFQSIAAAMREKTWPGLYDKFGEDVMEGILKDLGGKQ